MRTLKKTLALVLVLAMMFSLCVTASADFTDADEIKYVEAADVMAAIGVIEGMPDGSFDAKGTLTRAQAAVMITRLLGAEDYAIATEGEFTDVSADHWAAGAISFCVDAGIVAGYGDGTFGPSDTLTGYQWAKMLLCALGYNAETEGMTGAAWQIAVAKLAKANGLFVGNDKADKTVAATREEAALYAFNLLGAYTVEYKGGNSVIVGDIVFTSGGELVQGDKDNDDTDTFNAVYFPELVKLPLTAAENGGLAAAMWYVNGDLVAEYDAAKDTLVGVYDKEAVSKTFTAGTKYTAIAKELGMKNSAKTYDVEIYRNGELKETMDDVAGSYFYTTYAAATDVVPNGVVVDVVVTNTGTIRLLINVYYLGVIGYGDAKKDTTKDDVDDRYVVLTNTKNDAEFKLTAADYANFEDIYAAAAALEKDEALYYVIQPEGDNSASDYLLSMVEAKTTTGYITAAKTNDYIKVDDVKTYYSAVASNKVWTASKTQDYVFYLDSNGFILAAVEAQDAYVAPTYIYVHKTKANVDDVAGDSLFEGSEAASAQAKVVDLATGEIAVVDIAVVKNLAGQWAYANASGKATEALVVDDKEPVAEPGIYKYTVLADGTYVFGAEADDVYANLEKNVATVATNGNRRATSTTTFTTIELNYNKANVLESATVTTVTGYQNFPVTKVSIGADDIALQTLNKDNAGIVESIVLVKDAAAVADKPIYGIYAGAGETNTDDMTAFSFVGKEDLYVYEDLSDEAFAALEAEIAALEKGTVVALTLTNGQISAINALTDEGEYATMKVAYIDSTYLMAEGAANGTTVALGTATILDATETPATYEAVELAIGDTITYYMGEDAKGNDVIDFIIVTAHAE